jgi:transcriptional regulator with GAF, ATPase, and Fis domain
MLVADLQADPRFAPAGGAEARVRQAGLRSRLVVPLRSRGRTVGTFSATSYTPALYREEHLEAFRRVADLIAPFIENVVLLHRERRRRRRLAALTGLASVFGASLNIQARFAQLAEAVRPHLGFDLMAATLPGPGGQAVAIPGQAGAGGEAASPEPPPLGALSIAPRVERGEAVLLHDGTAELDRAHPGDRALLETGSRSGLLLPLRIYGQAAGSLFFGKREPSWYNSADLEVGEAIAAQVVVALQHQRLAEEREERARLEGRARQLEARLVTLGQELGDRYGFDRILGRAPVFLDALDRAAKVAATETTVLLTGESGTGKELVARAIHHGSPRADGPFIALNCAALSESLVESELFGHERGAFTGADKQKPGRFELAAAGTLFLDEVAELPPLVQAKLLRVLQEHEFERVGGTVTLKADVRLVAATNRDLAAAVQEGRFREDLYYRLNVFSVHLPPLRERGEDVVLLAQHLVGEIARRLGKKGERALDRDALAVLRAHRWPGNVRELENAIERALILAEGRLVTAVHLGVDATAEPDRTRPDHSSAAAPATPQPLAEMEKRAIQEALAETGGNKTRAAARLGITRTQLHTRLKRFGIG